MEWSSAALMGCGGKSGGGEKEGRLVKEAKGPTAGGKKRRRFRKEWSVRQTGWSRVD